ncbi:hypothetical protein SAMN05444920_102202 [Nonomuraea solani]|uniref:Uncharacterized protein n=2 Tax=Nonomuraea solani TaxID=1144553 RepID=A0A1H5YB97_9ACTN|nr:hypothetical protein SAMN05444920_102202 [Nonomuraea solani]
MVPGRCEPRTYLEDHGQAYVLRVRATFALTLGGGNCLTCEQAVAKHLRQKRRWTIACSTPSPTTYRRSNTPPTGRPGNAAIKPAPAGSITEPV